MNKKITVYYAKDADEAARIQAVLQANGIEAEEKSLGESGCRRCGWGCSSPPGVRRRAAARGWRTAPA